MHPVSKAQAKAAILPQLVEVLWYAAQGCNAATLGAAPALSERGHTATTSKAAGALQAAKRVQIPQLLAHESDGPANACGLDEPSSEQGNEEAEDSSTIDKDSTEPPSEPELPKERLPPRQRYLVSSTGKTKAWRKRQTANRQATILKAVAEEAERQADFKREQYERQKRKAERLSAQYKARRQAKQANMSAAAADSNAEAAAGPDKRAAKKQVGSPPQALKNKKQEEVETKREKRRTSVGSDKEDKRGKAHKSQGGMALHGAEQQHDGGDQDKVDYDVVASDKTLSEQQIAELTQGKTYNGRNFEWFTLSKAIIALLRYRRANYKKDKYTLHDWEVVVDPGSLAHGGVTVPMVAHIFGVPESDIWTIAMGDHYPDDGQSRFMMVLAKPPHRPQPVLVVTHEERRSKALGHHNERRDQYDKKHYKHYKR